MKLLFIIAVFPLLINDCNSQENKTMAVISAHSHNDYEQKNPLTEALSFHFKSVEADIFKVGDSLYVAHDANQINLGEPF